MRRCFPRRRGRGLFARGNGRACHKVMILFWNWPKSSPFFHAGCASCGVLAGDSGAGVGENRGGFREILVAGLGRFRSSFRRFCWALGEGGRRWACARVASGAGRRKKVHPTAHALWDAPKKGIMGRKSVENLLSARRRVGAALRVGGGVRRFSLRGRGNRCRTARKWSTVIDLGSEKGEG